MLNVTNHQRDANWKHNETPSHTCQSRYHQQINKQKCWWGCGEKGTLVHRWWKCRLVQPLWKTVWRYLKKLKMDLPLDPTAPLLGIQQKKPKTLIWKNISTPMSIAALFTIDKVSKQPKCLSVDKGIKQLCDIYTRKYDSDVKKKRKFYPLWQHE